MKYFWLFFKVIRRQAKGFFMVQWMHFLHLSNTTHKEILMVKSQWCETKRTTGSKQKYTVLCFNCSSRGPESDDPGLNSVGKLFSVFGLTCYYLSVIPSRRTDCFSATRMIPKSLLLHLWPRRVSQYIKI